MRTNRLIALSVAAVVCIASSNGGTTSQDLKTGYLGRRHAEISAVKHTHRRSFLGTCDRLRSCWCSIKHSTIYSIKNLPRLSSPLDMEDLRQHARQEQAPDGKTYYVWHALEGNIQGATPGKYLVDDQGQIRFLVDPGISGRLSRRDDGTEVKKYYPPQVEIFTLITKGILNKQPSQNAGDGKLNLIRRQLKCQQMPWILVLLGVAVAVGYGTMRHIIVAFCGWNVFAAFGINADLRRRTGAIRGGWFQRAKKKRNIVATGIGNESRRAVFHGLYCRRHIGWLYFVPLHFPFSEPIQ